MWEAGSKKGQTINQFQKLLQLSFDELFGLGMQLTIFW